MSVSSLTDILAVPGYMDKYAADVTQEAAAAKDAIKAYQANPSKSTLLSLAQALQEVQDNNPSHLNGGYYSLTKDILDRSNEMIQRGNPIRGLISKYLAVPLYAAGDTLFAPLTALGRTVASNTNLGFDTPAELRSNDPNDTEHNVQAANELLRLLSAERPDPTKQMEGINYTTGQFMNNTPKEVAKTVAGVASGSIPYVFEGIYDLLSAPHTALLNAGGLNGISRKDWERSKIK